MGEITNAFWPGALGGSWGSLGEAATTEITRGRDAQGFDENKQAAAEGGSVAGTARKELEVRSGKKVVSGNNYLPGNVEKTLPGKE